MRKLSQDEWVAVTVGLTVVVVVFYLFVPLGFLGTGTQSNVSSNTTILTETVTESGLLIKDIVEGKGDRAEVGKILVVHYVGRLADGTQFDSSVDRSQPFAFVLGRGDVIRGWDEGFEGMRVGGRRILVIPSELGYGALGAGSIPPHAILVFEVILLDVRNVPTE